MSANYVERGEMDRMRSELEGSTRLELNQKLEEVNTYLEEQSKAREKIDQMRDDNENVMKQEFEKSKKELMVGVEFLCVYGGWMNAVFFVIVMNAFYVFRTCVECTCVSNLC